MYKTYTTDIHYNCYVYTILLKKVNKGVSVWISLRNTILLLDVCNFSTSGIIIFYLYFPYCWILLLVYGASANILFSFFKCISKSLIPVTLPWQRGLYCPDDDGDILVTMTYILKMMDLLKCKDLNCLESCIAFHCNRRQ